MSTPISGSPPPQARQVRYTLDEHDEVGVFTHWKVTVTQTVRIAWRSMMANRTRTCLTLLGMVIGVGAVICSVGLGAGAAQRIQEQLANMGENLLITHTNNPRLRFTFASVGAVTTMTEEDARMMAQRFRDTIVRVAPTARGNVTVKVGNRSWYCQCVAVTPEYAFVNKHPAMQGRFISDDDVRGRTKVCVIGATTVENVFGSEDIDVIGKNVLLNRIQFKIVGVLKRKGIGGFGRDEDDTVLVPLSTGMRRLFNVTYLSGINIQCSDESKMDVAMEQVSNFYRDRHKLTPPFPRNDDFHVHNQGAMLQLTSGASLQLTGMLTGIALVSLVVGGVGIMNIMLVTVNERTREIGLRKAVGATGMQILLQFLVEAIVVSFMGGVLGIAFGLGVAKILNTYLDMRTLITMQSIIISVAVSCAIGLFFGIYPAAKAAQLHPIDALRYE